MLIIFGIFNFNNWFMFSVRAHCATHSCHGYDTTLYFHFYDLSFSSAFADSRCSVLLSSRNIEIDYRTDCVGILIIIQTRVHTRTHTHLCIFLLAYPFPLSFSLPRCANSKLVQRPLHFLLTLAMKLADDVAAKSSIRVPWGKTFRPNA